MHKKMALLTGVALAALLASAAAPRPAAADPIPTAFSYADLLEPVPDAGARLAADDVLQAQGARLQLAQYGGHHHHHHHHSWQWYRDNGYYWSGRAWALIPHYHHHHHSWQWYQARGYYWNGWAWTPRVYGHHHHHHHHHAQW